MLEPRRWDLLNAKESIKLVHAFLSGPELIPAYMERQKKKVVDVWDPYPELIFSLDAIPLFPPRYQRFTYKNVDTLLAAITRITRTFGWDALNNLLRMAFFTRMGAEIVETLFTNLIDAFGEGITREPIEVTGKNPVATRDLNVLYSCMKAPGRLRTLTRNVSGLKFELLCECKHVRGENPGHGQPRPVSQGIEVPDGDGQSVEMAMEDRLASFIAHVEARANTRFSEAKLAEAINTTNEIKIMYKELLFDIYTGDIIPYNPLTFGTILFFIMASFYDMNSNLASYAKNIQNIIKEFHGRVRDGKGFKTDGTRKVLVFPSFPGLDISGVKVVSALNALPVLADWEITGFLEPVDASNNVLKRYARHVLQTGQNLTGRSPRVTPHVIRVAQDLRVDGVAIQRNLGCKMPGARLATIEREAHKSGIPTTIIDTAYPGDDIVHYISKISSLLYTING